MSLRPGLRTARAVTALSTGVALLVSPLAASASADVPVEVPAEIAVVGVSAPSGGHMSLKVRYRCTPGMLTQIVGTYGRESFDWVGADELYGQEESRLFDLPCTGSFRNATIALVITERVPRTVYVHAGIGVSDPDDWSSEVANDSDRLRRRR